MFSWLHTNHVDTIDEFDTPAIEVQSDVFNISELNIIFLLQLFIPLQSKVFNHFG